MVSEDGQREYVSDIRIFVIDILFHLYCLPYISIQKNKNYYRINK